MSNGMSATDEADKIAIKREDDERGQSVSVRRQYGGMRLGAVLVGVERQLSSWSGAANPAVSQVTCDSRRVKGGALFVAIPGPLQTASYSRKKQLRAERWRY